MTLHPIQQSAAARLGRAIKAIRKLRGLKQSELAEKLGVTNVAISYWETGDRSPSLENIRLAAEIMRVPVSTIFLLAETGEDDCLLSQKAVRLLDGGVPV